MTKLVGCPFCLLFNSIGENTVGYICRCGRYVSDSQGWYTEEEFEELKKKGAKLAARNVTSITPEYRELRKHMEGRAEKYAEKVRSGKGVKYNDPNK